MKKEKPTTKLCKHCKTEIPYDAKVCPNCRKKQKGGKLKWILIIAVVAVIALLIYGSGNSYKAKMQAICPKKTIKPHVAKLNTKNLQDLPKNIKEIK